MNETCELSGTVPDSDLARLDAALSGKIRARTAAFYQAVQRPETRLSRTEAQRRRRERERRQREREQAQQQARASWLAAVRAAQAVPVARRTIAQSALLVEAARRGVVSGCGWVPAGTATNNKGE